jgi:hypothetical protein
MGNIDTGLKGYLLWKRDILWSEEEKKDRHKRLTTYFRVRGDVLNALE